MPRFTIAILGLIFVVLIAAVTFGYLKLSKFEDQVASTHATSNLALSDGTRGITNRNTQENTVSEWLGNFKAEQAPNYVYPALELSISFDLSAPEKSYKQFRVLIGKLDAYKFFCLNQVLTHNGVNYAFYKNAHNIQLMVNAKSEEYLNTVLEQLKLYDISYKVEQI